MFSFMSIPQNSLGYRFIHEVTGILVCEGSGCLLNDGLKKKIPT